METAQPMPSCTQLVDWEGSARDGITGMPLKAHSPTGTHGNLESDDSKPSPSGNRMDNEKKCSWEGIRGKDIIWIRRTGHIPLKNGGGCTGFLGPCRFDLARILQKEATRRGSVPRGNWFHMRLPLGRGLGKEAENADLCRGASRRLSSSKLLADETSWKGVAPSAQTGRG